ncbi:uncharacterized protein LOC135922753 isoform X2 [Gordionus sp. m RMFG-2023]|uniref:uncharacterized protein LOC135922753 isoform X2 n=1 Tax=Gordionus sp. m RMFG-2023 TaxID=3053472 RepID=UPI0031FD9F70
MNEIKTIEHVSSFHYTTRCSDKKKNLDAEEKSEPIETNQVLKKSAVVRKQRKTWEQWSAEETNLFFEALSIHGKNFDLIWKYIGTKLGKNMTRNKEQIRHFYYRTWAKMSQYIKYKNEAQKNSAKKNHIELYCLLSYGEIRKKFNAVLDDDKKFRRRIKEHLTHLIFNGSSWAKFKDRKIRIKLPACEALKNININNNAIASTSILDSNSSTIISADHRNSHHLNNGVQNGDKTHTSDPLFPRKDLNLANMPSILSTVNSLNKMSSNIDSANTVHHNNHANRMNESLLKPTSISVLLTPRGGKEWIFVQALAQNPRVKIKVLPGTRLEEISRILFNKWGHTDTARCFSAYKDLLTNNERLTAFIRNEKSSDPALNEGVDFFAKLAQENENNPFPSPGSRGANAINKTPKIGESIHKIHLRLPNELLDSLTQLTNVLAKNNCTKNITANNCHHDGVLENIATCECCAYKVRFDLRNLFAAKNLYKKTVGELYSAFGRPSKIHLQYEIEKYAPSTSVDVEHPTESSPSYHDKDKRLFRSLFDLALAESCMTKTSTHSHPSCAYFKHVETQEISESNHSTDTSNTDNLISSANLIDPTHLTLESEVKASKKQQLPLPQQPPRTLLPKPKHAHFVLIDNYINPSSLILNHQNVVTNFGQSGSPFAVQSNNVNLIEEIVANRSGYLNSVNSIGGYINTVSPHSVANLVSPSFQVPQYRPRRYRARLRRSAPFTDRAQIPLIPRIIPLSANAPQSYASSSEPLKLIYTTNDRFLQLSEMISSKQAPSPGSCGQMSTLNEDIFRANNFCMLPDPSLLQNENRPLAMSTPTYTGSNDDDDAKSFTRNSPYTMSTAGDIPLVDLNRFIGGTNHEDRLVSGNASMTPVANKTDKLIDMALGDVSWLSSHMNNYQMDDNFLMNTNDFLISEESITNNNMMSIMRVNNNSVNSSSANAINTSLNNMLDDANIIHISSNETLIPSTSFNFGQVTCKMVCPVTLTHDDYKHFGIKNDAHAHDQNSNTFSSLYLNNDNSLLNYCEQSNLSFATLLENNAISKHPVSEDSEFLSSIQLQNIDSPSFKGLIHPHSNSNATVDEDAHLSSKIKADTHFPDSFL